MGYLAATDRYERLPYRRCGRSGISLPEVSLGLWQNFGDDRPLGTQRAIIRRAFDLGVTHFDLANNYGPPYGSAELNFGRIMREDLRPYRDELIISTKAGYDMWPGWAWSTWTSSTATAPTRTPRSRRPWALWPPRSVRAGPCTRGSPLTPPAGPSRRRPCCATSARRC